MHARSLSIMCLPLSRYGRRRYRLSVCLLLLHAIVCLLNFLHNSRSHVPVASYIRFGHQIKVCCHWSNEYVFFFLLVCSMTHIRQKQKKYNYDVLRSMYTRHNSSLHQCLSLRTHPFINFEYSDSGRRGGEKSSEEFFVHSHLTHAAAVA